MLSENVNCSKYLGVSSALLAALFTTLFGVFIVLNNPMLYFITCLFLAIAVVVMVISLKSFISLGKKVLAECAITFVVMYAVLVSMVYYTQVAVVLKGTLSTEMLLIVSDVPGTVFFYIDMFGYCFLCLATLFIAFAVEGNKMLKGFLFVHSAIFIPTFLLPFMPITFSTVQPAGGEVSGPLILVLWCIIFVPVCLLLAVYFGKQQTTSKNPMVEENRSFT